MSNQKFLDATGVEYLWNKITPKAIGAAPDGYGYGGQAIDLGWVNNEDELNAAINEIYGDEENTYGMSNSETKLIKFQGYPSANSNEKFGDYNFYGILSRSSSSFGSLFVQSAYDNGSIYIKSRKNGNWQNIELLSERGAHFYFPSMVESLYHGTSALMEFNGKNILFDCGPLEANTKNGPIST